MKPTAMKHLVLAKRNESYGFGYGLKRFFLCWDNEKKRIFAPCQLHPHPHWRMPVGEYNKALSKGSDSHALLCGLVE